MPERTFLEIWPPPGLSLLSSSLVSFVRFSCLLSPTLPGVRHVCTVLRLTPANIFLAEASAVAIAAAAIVAIMARARLLAAKKEKECECRVLAGRFLATLN